MRVAIVDRAIDTPALLSEVARHSNGASVLFIGTVRDVNDGRDVMGIEYKAYRTMAELELSRLAEEATERYDTLDVVIEHRVGALELGDISVAIAVAHPHRAAAFDAARFVIEELKRRVPIWKLEQYSDGTREWVEAGKSGSSQPAALGEGA
jgi:molybdopterin synthase catalytic subunit